MTVREILKRAQFPEHWLRMRARDLNDAELDRLKDALYDQLCVEAMQVVGPILPAAEVE